MLSLLVVVIADIWQALAARACLRRRGAHAWRLTERGRRCAHCPATDETPDPRDADLPVSGWT